jgi:DNA-binding response OmpR family regulator
LLTSGNDKSRTVVALPDPTASKNIRKTLQDAGFSHCREVASLPKLEERLASDDVDLLITTLNDRGWDSGDLIRRIRHGELGNPFMIIMVLLDQPVPAMVNKVVGAGADDLLLAPWLGRLVLGRLEVLIHGRKPFFVTHNYVGPERRTQRRSTDPPTLDVPNPLQWLTVAKGSREDLQLAVDEARRDVSQSKVRNCGNQLRFLADRVVANFNAGGQAAIIVDMQTLLSTSAELRLHAADTRFSPAIELAESLSILSQRLLQSGRTPRVEEVAVLPTLADAVVAAISEHELEIEEQHDW